MYFSEISDFGVLKLSLLKGEVAIFVFQNENLFSIRIRVSFEIPG